MKKLITFSLWGKNPVYTRGAYRNAELAKEIYPDWICRFYIAAKNTPQEVIDRLEAYSNTEVIIVDEEGSHESTMWRFTPCDENDVECFISRDTDSRLSFREKLAVEEWLKSDKDFHIMRDHPYHNTAIMAGMWGMKNTGMKMGKLIENYLSLNSFDNKKGIDQNFLSTCVWDIAKNNNVTHDPFFEQKPFPQKRGDRNDLVYFVGECVREDDTVWSEDDRDQISILEVSK